MPTASLPTPVDRGLVAVLLGLLAGLLLGLGASPPATAQSRIYVDADATGAGTGTSWSDAFTSLQNALTEEATVGDTVWVAEGTYYPDEGTSALADDPTESFVLLDSLKVFGGFDGTETTLDERDVTAHRTILSGDIEQDDADSDGDGLILSGDIIGGNSYHVVEGARSGARLDGVSVTAGQADGALAPNDRGGGLYVPPQSGSEPALTVARTRIVGNRALASGGGVSIANADVVLSNVEILGNTATNGDGGGLHVTANDYGDVWLTNAVFTGNDAGGNGGAVAQINGRTTMYGGTLTRNSAAGSGGGFYAGPNASSALLRYTTAWGNTAGIEGPQIYTETLFNVTVAVLEGGAAAIGGPGSPTTSRIVDAAPLFVDAPGPDGTAGTPDDDLRLNWASPGIDPIFQAVTPPADSADVDNDGDFAEPLPIDLAGNPRVQGRSADAGAYEGGAVPRNTSVVYADSAQGTDTGPSGGSWSAPYRTLQAALDAARHAAAADGGVFFGEVWVAEGTYYPDEGPGRQAGETAASFTLVDSVSVYGGFQNGDAFAQRVADPAANGTVLSGDIGVAADTSDNSNSVVSAGLVYGSDLGPATTLDGFTITGGTATQGQELGGGLLLVAYNGRTLSPTLRNLRITTNYAQAGAGLAVIADSGSTARPRLSAVDVVENVASRIAGGMALSADEGTMAARLANVRLLGNRAAQGAALGVSAQRSGTAAPTFANLLVSGNVSAADSMAAVFRNASDATLAPTFVNTTWAQNTAASDSLGALLDVQAFEDTDLTVHLANSILWGNTARTIAQQAEDTDGPVRIDSSVVQGGWQDTGEGNVDADPRYVDGPGPDGQPGTTDDSLQVLLNSPALNLGGTSFLPDDSTDLDGDGDRGEQLPLDLARTARVQSGGVDAGAYEGASSNLPTVTLSGPGEPLSPGTGTSVEITVPDTFVPTEGTFYYRPAGAPAFQSVPLDFAGVEPGTETIVTVDVPGDAVTERGTQYYAEVTGTRTGGSETLHLRAPRTAPLRTAFLPVRLERARAQGSFRPETYRMLSVPVALGDRSAFEVLETQYGAYDPKRWRLARWAPRDSSYRYGREAGPLRPGRAAWFVTVGGDSLTIPDVRSADAGEPRAIPLRPGWNQIASPFPFPVAWTDVSRPDAVGPPAAYDGTRPRGERYRFEAPALPAWRGAFVYNAADTSVTIRVPPVEATDATTQSPSDRRRAAAAPDGYRLRPIATLRHDDRRLRDRTTWLGFAEGAEAGFGPEDLAKPPAVGPHVRLDARPSDGPPLARSLRPPSSEGAAWTLRLGLHLEERLRSAETVTLQLAERGHRPDGFRRYVVDLDRGRRLPLTNGSATVRLTPDRPARRLRVIVGTEAFAEQNSDGAPLTIDETTLRTNAPNPFRESTTISYQLAERQTVTIAIYDLLGRRVETLVDGPRAAGVHQTTWRATGAAGQSLASGVYFCRMEAGAHTSTRKLVLVR